MLGDGCAFWDGCACLGTGVCVLGRVHVFCDACACFGAGVRVWRRVWGQTARVSLVDKITGY